MASIYKRRPDFIGIALLGVFLIGVLGLTVRAVHVSTFDGALRRAIQTGDLKAMATAIKNGADINADHGEALMTVIGTGTDAKRRRKMLEFLFSHGFDKKAAFAQDSLITDVLMQGDASTLEYLIEQGATFRIKSDKQQSSALFDALMQGQQPCAIVLLNHGADPNDKDRAGLTVLGEAVLQQRDTVVTALLKRGAAADTKTANALLLYGGEKNNLEFVKAALDNGGDANTKDKISGATTLHTAVVHKNREMVNLLLRGYADVNLGDGKHPPLYYAALKGDAEMVRLLLEKGANTKHITGLVSIARTNGTPELVNMLLAKGAKD